MDGVLAASETAGIDYMVIAVGTGVTGASVTAHRIAWQRVTLFDSEEQLGGFSTERMFALLSALPAPAKERIPTGLGR